MKRTSWLKGMKVGAALVPVLVGLVYLTAVRAQLTTPITVNVTYPLTTIADNRIGGSSVQQVFQLGSSAAAGIFTGLNPRTGTCPGGGAPVFLSGNAAAISATSYVYAAQVTNSNQSNVELFSLTQSLCPDRAMPLTSVGYCPGAGLDNPENANEQATGLDFNFGSTNPSVPALAPGATSAFLFFTAIEPPRAESTGINGAGVNSQGFLTGSPANLTPFIGPCRAGVTISKEISCPASGPFSEGPITALSGQQIFYRVTVTNNGAQQLTSVVINDPQLGGNITSGFNFTTPPGSGTLNPGQTVTRTLGPFTAGTQVSGVNTATVTANLAVAGQTISFSATDSVTLNVVNPQISCDKTVNGAKEVNGYTPGSQLTYVLTGTNAAGSGANLNLTLTDPTLSGLPGVSCVVTGTATAAPLPQVFNNVPPGQTRSVTCTVTFATEAAFQAAAGGDSVLNNTLTVSGVVTPGQTGICGGAPGGPALNCTSQALVRLQPPPPPPDSFCPINLNQGNPNAPVGPGLPYPATAEVSDQKAGSILFYNLYTSDGSNPVRQNTSISITNTSPGLGVFVHLFFVAENCTVADVFICLTQNQTANFLASDLDPGITGYLVAVAVNDQGCPINFNYLIGDAYVKLASGHSANLGAEAFAAIAANPAPECDGSLVTTELRLDGVRYNRAPRVLASSNIQSPLDGNNTLLVLNRVGGNLATGAATLGNLFGILYNDAETGLSFTFNAGVCQFRGSLTGTFPRTTPRVDAFIPAGRSGWLKLYSQSDIAILGAQLNANPNTTTQAGAFSGGHNLHKLTLSPAATLIVPSFPPGVGIGQ